MITLRNIRVVGSNASAILDVDGVQMPVTVKVTAQQLRRLDAMCRDAIRRWSKAMARAEIERYRSVSGDGEIGFGFLKKVFKKVKRAAQKVTPKFVQKIVNRVARSKLGRFVRRKSDQLVKFARKAGRKMKEIAQHPAFQASVFAVSQIVPGAQGLGFAYVAAMAALRVADGLSKKDPRAVKALSAYVTNAAKGDPTANAVMEKYNAIKNTLQAPPDVSKLLDGLKGGLPGLPGLPQGGGPSLSMSPGGGSLPSFLGI